MPPVEAVVFDLDGLLLDSEGAWAAAKERLTEEREGRWKSSAVEDMLGLASLVLSSLAELDPAAITAAGQG
ncbi:MAG TPA: hypothetical protein VNB64_11460 [Solirubrobacteraceae bacterium]|nr:hypothetical protein [Solirubrobacteraceae bacterium]